MAPRYQAVVGAELRKYGLRYEDLYDPQLDLVSACYLRNLLACGMVGRRLQFEDLDDPQLNLVRFV